MTVCTAVSRMRSMLREWMLFEIILRTRRMNFYSSRESLVGGKLPFLRSVFFLKRPIFSVSRSTVSE